MTDFTPPSANPDRAVLEQLAFASLKEQRAARRWGVFFKLCTLIIVVGLLMYLFGVGQKVEPTAEHTALISIEGDIDAGGSNSADKVMAALNNAFEADKAKAVVLRINSPGGSPVQAAMIVAEIKRLRELHPDKPVYAVAEDLCASAAYYIAASADDIYVNGSSVVGSIGVIMSGFGANELIQKLGIERRVYTAGKNKDILDPFKPVDDAQRAHIQTMLDDVHAQFIASVKEGRGERLKETPDMFSGLFWTGRRAIELGLADNVGTVDSVARDIVKAEDVVDYTMVDSALDRINKRLGGQVGTAIGHVLMTGGSNVGSLR
ncbi:S49 family peptidase [soil metagenome]